MFQWISNKGTLRRQTASYLFTDISLIGVVSNQLVNALLLLLGFLAIGNLLLVDADNVANLGQINNFLQWQLVIYRLTTLVLIFNSRGGAIVKDKALSLSYPRIINEYQFTQL